MRVLMSPRQFGLVLNLEDTFRFSLLSLVVVAIGHNCLNCRKFLSLIDLVMKPEVIVAVVESTIIKTTGKLPVVENSQRV